MATIKGKRVAANGAIRGIVITVKGNRVTIRTDDGKTVTRHIERIIIL